MSFNSMARNRNLPGITTTNLPIDPEAVPLRVSAIRDWLGHSTGSSVYR